MKRKNKKIIKTVFIVLVIMCVVSLLDFSEKAPIGSKPTVDNITTTTTTTNNSDNTEKPEENEDVILYANLHLPSEDLGFNATEGDDYASFLGLDDDVFDVNFIKNNGSRNAYFAANGEIRLYYSSYGTGGNIVIRSTKKIISVRITFANKSGLYRLNTQEYTSADTFHVINGNEVIIQNIDTTTSAQVIITSIEITYYE